MQSLAAIQNQPQASNARWIAKQTEPLQLTGAQRVCGWDLSLPRSADVRSALAQREGSVLGASSRRTCTNEHSYSIRWIPPTERYGGFSHASFWSTT